MAVPSDISQLPTIPWPTTADPPDELVMQAMLLGIALRIGALPKDYSGAVGQLLVVNAAGTGVTTLENSGLSAIDLAGLGVTGSALSPVTITGSGLLSWNAHLGRGLVYAGTSNITLTLNLDSTGQNGVKSGFQCLVERAYDGNSVGQVHLVIGSGLTSQQPSGLLGVGPGGVVSVRVVGARVWLNGSVVS